MTRPPPGPSAESRSPASRIPASPGPPLLLTDPHTRPVIAHRGASAYAPENTLAAFRRALELGADALELDVRLTRDGEVVVAHDATLLRMTGDPRRVAQCTLAELRAVDAGARFSANAGATFPFAGRGVLVPTLAEVLEEFPAVPLLVEVKEVAAGRAARDVIARAGAVARCVVAGVRAAALLPFREPPWLYGAATVDAARLYLPALLGVGARATACRAFSVPVRWRGLPVPTRRFVRAAHSAGAAVHVWTVDDPALGHALWARRVNGLVTNRPDVMVAARAALGAG